MISYKGRIGFIQYMPKKPKKWGLKAFALSDSHSGYVYNWHLYTGKFSMLCVCVWVCESDRAKAFNPHFLGFLGMYWMNPILPL